MASSSDLLFASYLQSVSSGDLEAVRSLTASNPHFVNKTDDEGRTPLFIANSRKIWPIVRFLTVDCKARWIPITDLGSDRRKTRSNAARTSEIMINKALNRSSQVFSSTMVFKNDEDNGDSGDEDCDGNAMMMKKRKKNRVVRTIRSGTKAAEAKARNAAIARRSEEARLKRLSEQKTSNLRSKYGMVNDNTNDTGNESSYIRPVNWNITRRARKPVRIASNKAVSAAANSNPFFKRGKRMGPKKLEIDVPILHGAAASEIINALDEITDAAAHDDIDKIENTTDDNVQHIEANNNSNNNNNIENEMMSDSGMNEINDTTTSGSNKIQDAHGNDWELVPGMNDNSDSKDNNDDQWVVLSPLI